MDRIRRLGKSNASSNKIEGCQQVHKENHYSTMGSPSLVARLMGLDRFPSQQQIDKQQSSVNHNILSTESVALQSHADLLEGRHSNKKSSKEQPEFRDVFEDTVKRSGSNKDVILDILEQPDPLFEKHLHGVQGSSSSSLCHHLTALKQSKEKIEAKDRKVERKTSKKHSKQTHKDDSLNHSCSHTSSHNSSRPSENSVEGKEGFNNGTARIVILKPNYAMARDARNSFSSVDSSSADISGSRKYMTDWTKDEGYPGTIDFSNDMEISGSKYREAREIAKKVTRRIRETTLAMKEREARETAKKFNKEVQEVFGRMRIDFPSCVKEIPGTGGLHDFSGIDSASESEVMKMTSYDSTESFVSRQAKKRLLERWKRAQQCEHAGVGGKGSTLGEMLSISDDKLRNLDSAKFVNGHKDDSDRKLGTARWDSPLGISSRDGWKDKSSKSSSRSRSLPPTGTKTEKLNAESEYRLDDKLLMLEEARYQGQNQEVNGKFDGKEDFSSKSSRFNKRISRSRPPGHVSSSCTFLESHLSHDKTEIEIAKTDSPEEQSMVPPTTTVSPVSSDELPSYISTSMLKQCDTSAGRQQDPNPKGSTIDPSERVFIVQFSGAEAETSGCSKEADHSSPVTVLQVPSRDVLSGPECFEQVSAGLTELRKQLNLLRRESKTCVELPMLIKTDVGEGSSLAVDDKGIVVSACWESSYIADVLIESGFYDSDTDMFMARWNSPNCPLGEWVFEDLENRYCDEIAGPRHERKLLFDRINSAFSEISQSFMNLCPRVKPGTARFGLKWQKCEVRDELHKLLAVQEKEACEDISGMLFDKEAHWLDPSTSIDIIGKDLEKMLINDLVTEVVTLLSL